MAVPAGIVDHLQSVDIRKTHNDGVVIALRQFQLLFTERHERSPVVKASQRICGGEQLEFASGLMTHRRAAHGAHETVWVQLLCNNILLGAHAQSLYGESLMSNVS